MDQKQFIKQLTAEIDNFFKALSTDSGDWVVKGFIWMNYLTKDMARAIDSPIPFHWPDPQKLYHCGLEGIR